MLTEPCHFDRVVRFPRDHAGIVINKPVCNHIFPLLPALIPELKLLLAAPKQIASEKDHKEDKLEC